MKDHLASNATFLATLWKLTAKDATVIRACNHTRHITYNAELYYALPLTPTNVKKTVGLAPDNAELAAILSDDGLVEFDLLAQKWSHAKLEITVVNYLDLSLGPAVSEKGVLGEITIADGALKAEYRSKAELLNQPIGRVYQPECDAELGDGRCGVDLTTFTHTTTIAAVTNRRQFTIALTGKPDGYFRNGIITFTSGLNDGLSERIVTNVGQALTLELPMFATVAVADAVTVIAGCDKKRETCKTFGSNTVTSEPAIYFFRGFPDLPGRERIFKTRPDGR